MTPLLSGDDDVRARLDAVTTVGAIRAALVAHHQGALQAPARVRAGLGDPTSFSPQVLRTGNYTL